MPSGSLHLCLLRARGLKHGDWLSKTDAYVIITCGSHEQKSNVATNQGSNPIWNQFFTFNVWEGTDKLLLKFMDEDFFTPDDPLGTATVPLGEVFRCGQIAEESYPVVLPNGNFKGEVVLSLSFEQLDGSSHGAGHHKNGDQYQSSSGFQGPYNSSGAGGWTQGMKDIPVSMSMSSNGLAHGYRSHVNTTVGLLLSLYDQFFKTLSNAFFAGQANCSNSQMHKQNTFATQTHSLQFPVQDYAFKLAPQ